MLRSTWYTTTFGSKWSFLLPERNKHTKLTREASCFSCYFCLFIAFNTVRTFDVLIKPHRPIQSPAVPYGQVQEKRNRDNTKDVLTWAVLVCAVKEVVGVTNITHVSAIFVTWSAVTSTRWHAQSTASTVQELIRRWDSKRELFYDDIVHVLQNTENRTYFV